MIRSAIFIALAFACPASAQSISGIASSGDGDSFMIGEQGIRLFGIDAPEYKQPCQVNHSNWACGADAAAALRSLIDNRPIVCIARDKDVYGRVVARCMIDGQDLAAKIVKQGYAVVLDNGQADYAAVEARAKATKAGIWASTFLLPSDYRHANPRKPEPVTASTYRTRTYARPQVRSGGNMYYSCTKARADGVAPMYRGQPTYNSNLDGDHDGIACEPYRGR